MVQPVTTVRIDWDNDGDWGDVYESVADRVLRLSWTRGRSADFSAEAIGSATIVLRNDDDLYTPDSATGPTAAQLVPGRPVHIYATYSAVDYPLFYGYIERLEYDPRDRTVTITCYDPLRRLAETDVIVPANSYAAHSARTMRRAVLEDFERGTRNLLVNPSFETDTSNWTHNGTSLTRTATDAAPGGGTAYGAFVVAGGGAWAYAYARLAPIYFEGETYRFSVYLKVASGTATWKVGLGTTLGADANERSVTVTDTWQRFTATYTMTADQTGSGANPLVGWIDSTAAGTVRIDNAAITRGTALYPYSTAGTGRWPNWVGNGDFEGNSAASGWVYPLRNFLPNPSFETDASGWDTAALTGAHTAATSLVRNTTDPKYGVGHATLVNPASSSPFSGMHSDLMAATFVAGVTYDYGVWVKKSGGAFYGSTSVGIGSATFADYVLTTANADTGNYALFTGSYTPSNTATDVRMFVRDESGTGTTLLVDGAFVYRRSTATLQRYWDTGPGGGGIVPTSLQIAANAGKYGYQSLYVTTPATADTGAMYDFNHYGPRFVSGQQYILSLWVYPDSSMPYKVGISADKADGTFDEATTTGTASANVWTQITRTWTPSADRDTDTALEGVVFLYQTDATARTFRVDGVRVIPGGTADDFEMPQWDLDTNGAAGEAGDRYLATASLSGSALAALSTINGLTLTRHWIEPTMAAPWYSYVTEDRVTYAAKASVETYNDDLHDMTQADIDRASIVNIVPVTWDDGAEHYSDADSVAAYGPSPSGGISGAAFFPDRAIPDIIGPALVARYRDPRARPEITVQNRWPSLLARELDDMVTVNFSRLLISGREYVILRLTTTVSDSGNWWETTYALEEHM